MSLSSSAPERIDLKRADDLRDVVHRAVACLAQGGVVGLPTETGYRLAASALQPAAVERVRHAAGDEGRDLALGLKGADEVADWVPRLSIEGRRLARRAWPGPVKLIFEGEIPSGLVRCLHPSVRAVVAPGATLSLCSPAHPIVREILRLTPGPLVLASASRDGQPQPSDLDAILQTPSVDMVLEEGALGAGRASSVVQVGPDGWRVVREGAIQTPALVRMAGTVILFVCTGNTCRSPMAEALCKKLLAERLNCSPAQLEERGYVVLSAGVAAAEGMPAAANAIDVVSAMGGSLKDHASRRLTPDLVEHADLIVTMSRDHYDVLVSHVPSAAPRTRLLNPQGKDVHDPVGLDRDTYKRTAREIEEHLRHLVSELAPTDRARF